MGAALLLASACRAERLLAPPDGAACTVGRLGAALGAADTVESRTTAASCVRFSQVYRTMVPAESWTMSLPARSAFVVRLESIEASPGIWPFIGTLAAYTRNRAGDPVVATVGKSVFGPPPFSRELILLADTAQEVSLRAESYGLPSVGPYRLIVERCPMLVLPLDSRLTGLNTTAGCRTRDLFDTPRRVTFISTPIDTIGDYRFVADRTAGTASIRSRVAGRGHDQTQSLSGSIAELASTAGRSQQVVARVNRPGLYTHAIATHPDSIATVTVVAEPAPPPPGARPR